MFHLNVSLRVITFLHLYHQFPLPLMVEGRHYSPPPCWGIDHRPGLIGVRKRVYQVIGKSEERASFLFTGADVDNLAIKHERFRDMEVYACVQEAVYKQNGIVNRRNVFQRLKDRKISVFALTEITLIRVRAKITSHFWRSDLC